MQSGEALKEEYEMLVADYPTHVGDIVMRPCIPCHTCFSSIYSRESVMRTHCG